MQALAGAGEEKWGRREIFSLDLVLGLPMMSECAITELRLRRFWGLFLCRHGRGIEAGCWSLTDKPVKEETGLAPGSE